jgi:integrase
MARITKPLTSTEVKTAKPKEKDYKLFDGGGLFLLVAKTGGKRWRLKYRFNNKEKILALGIYPNISLKDARELREKYKSLIAKDIDPTEEKKKVKEESKQLELEKENTFYKIAEEWLVSYKCEVSEGYHTDLSRAIENYIYPFIKNKPMNQITRRDCIEIIQHLKDKGIHESAKRTFMLLNKIFMYAVTLEYTPHNIIADIDKKTILGKIQRRHYPTFTKEKDIKGLLLSIDEYTGDYTTKMALKMLPFVFVRSFNIRHCEWVEIDFKNKEWIIPASKLKTKTEFILPLSDSVIEILEDVKKYTSDSKYVFPSFRNKNKPMSDNTLISALRRMGYTKEEFVPHSFRAMFSTIAYENMNEHGCSGEIIEALLAHKETNRVKEAYNRATYKDGMRKLVDWYSNYLSFIT